MMIFINLLLIPGTEIDPFSSTLPYNRSLLWLANAASFDQKNRYHVVFFTSRAAARSYAALDYSCSDFYFVQTFAFYLDYSCSCSDFCFFWHWNIFYWYFVIWMVIIFLKIEKIKLSKKSNLQKKSFSKKLARRGWSLLNVVLLDILPLDAWK